MSGALAGGIAAIGFGAATTTIAHAGGLFVPGVGAESTSRAGASVVETGGADALDLNPAGLARQHGTQIAFSSTFINYDLAFTRAGVYQPNSNLTTQPAWVGTPFPTVNNSAQPSTGFGSYQAVPLISVVSDLGNALPGFHFAFGIYAPSNTYPARNMDGNYTIDDPNVPPPPTRYDVMNQDASFILPTLGVAYHVNDSLDIGGRISVGTATIKSTVYLWGVQNYSESTNNDAIFKLSATDNFVPAAGLGAQYHLNKNIEFGAQYSTEIDINAKGDGSSQPSSKLTLGGTPVTIGPPDDAAAQCAKGGTTTALKSCVAFGLPATATIGGRWVFRDRDNAERGDIELDGTWEHWSASQVNNYSVLVDAVINGALALKESFIRHGFQDTYGVRLGGAYKFPVGDGALITRAGVAYDTAAAQPGWERVDTDGAARTTIAGGLGYTFTRFEIDLGASVVLEGTRTNGTVCQPSDLNQGCNGTGMDVPIGQRTGADPINPSIGTTFQKEDPMNHGVYSSHYLMFTVGIKTWF